MKFDVTVFANDLNDAGRLAATVEDYGFDGLWVAEAARNPFLPLAHAALETRRINLGTAIALAFPRSPLLTARTAWDLSRQSRGRFILGLGTQIKPHITKRFSSHWGKPLPQLRNYILALRDLWRGMRIGESTAIPGEYYAYPAMRHDMDGDDADAYEIPIYAAGVNTGLARLAGELCDGFHVHSFHTVPYLRETLLPAIQSGRARVRITKPLFLSCAVFVVTGSNAKEIEASKQLTKSQIAFYASTPSYRPVLEAHGWADLIPRLNRLLMRGKWEDMAELISDAMLAEFAVCAPPNELPYAVREKYAGLLDRIGFYFPFEPSDESQRQIWKYAAEAMAY